MATLKEIIKEVNQSFVDSKPEDFLKHCADDVRWDMLGWGVTDGKEAIRAFMAKMPDMKFELGPVSYMQEGDTVASYGIGAMTNKGGEKEGHTFCDIYRFEGDKIKTMTSYMIEDKKKDEKGA